MTPQILGNLTAVAQQIKQANQTALTAQQMAINAQQTASAATSAVAAVAGGQTLTLLNPFVTFTASDLAFDGNWHTLTVSNVPSGASLLYVGGYVKNQGSPDNARQTMLVRPSSSGQQMTISCSNGVAGNYEDDSAIGPCIVQSLGSTFQYKWSAAVTDTNFVVYGYLS